MKLISLTLVGPGTAHHIPDLVASLRPLTSRHMFVFWDAGDEERSAVARVTNSRARSLADFSSFGEARNAALTFASIWGDATHALMIDTDERWLDTGIPRAIVDGPPATCPFGPDIIHVKAMHGGHWSPRIFRLPVKGSYQGQVHEYFEPAPSASVARWVGPEIAELPKSAEELGAKWRRDFPILRAEVRKFPLEIRWRFYLGETSRGLGWLAREDHDEQRALLNEAAMWYLSATRLAITHPSPSDWEREQGGWAAYRAACALSEGGNESAALTAAVSGIEACPWLQELPWFLGWRAFQRKDFRTAARWARLASMVGACGPARMGFQEETCRPRELQGFALKALDDPEGDRILREEGVIPKEKVQ